MSSLNVVSPTYQTTDSTPITIVEMWGVWKRSWTRAKVVGIALRAAIASEVRAVGRIVVCVDAAADVSTAMIRILSSGVPNTSAPEAAQHVLAVLAQELGAGVGERRVGDDDVDRDQDQGRDDRRAARGLRGILRLLVDGRPRCPTPSR